MKKIKLPEVLKLQHDLEAIVEQYVSFGKNKQAPLFDGQFRGKRCFYSGPITIRELPRPGSRRKSRPNEFGKDVWQDRAFNLLQDVYRLQAAYRRRDVDEVLRLTWRVAVLDGELSCSREFGTLTEVILKQRRFQIDRLAKLGKSTRKRTPDTDTIVRAVFREQKQNRVSDEAAYVRTRSKLKADYDITCGRTTIRTIVRNGEAVNR